MRENLLKMGRLVLEEEPRQEEPTISCSFINDNRPCRFQPVITDRYNCFEYHIGRLEKDLFRKL